MILNYYNYNWRYNSAIKLHWFIRMGKRVVEFKKVTKCCSKMCHKIIPVDHQMELFAAWKSLLTKDQQDRMLCMGMDGVTPVRLKAVQRKYKPREVNWVYKIRPNYKVCKTFYISLYQVQCCLVQLKDFFIYSYLNTDNFCRSVNDVLKTCRQSSSLINLFTTCEVNTRTGHIVLNLMFGKWFENISVKYPAQPLITLITRHRDDIFRTRHWLSNASINSFAGFIPKRQKFNGSRWNTNHIGLFLGS